MELTREQWLQAMTDRLRPLFSEVCAELPQNIRVSVGWPTHKALASATTGSRTIGQCFSTACSGDKTHEVFISPCLETVAAVGGTLVHELIHAWDDCRNGHKGPFRRVALALGLEGKMTATTAGAALVAALEKIAAEIGPYPHKRLDLSNQKKQSTRLLKVECPECGYTVRTTAKWIEIGLPTCACGEEMVLPGGGEDE
jgi:ribosomal protein S27E